MNRSRIVPLGIALLCIASLAVVGTALDSSVTTDPADEIDLNYDRLPIGTSDAAAIRDEIDRGDDGEAEELDREEDGETEELDRGEDEGTATAQQSQRASLTGTGTSPPTLLSRFLALLGAVVRVLLLFGAIAAVAAFVYHYRERLLALFGTVETSDGRASEPTAAAAWPETEPSTPVDRAWLWMVRRAETESPATKTSAECATIAREAGIDPAAIDAITDAFERVHYGGVPVEREADRARKALERLRSDERRRSDGGRKRHHGDED